jgi:hypothetical protein
MDIVTFLIKPMLPPNANAFIPSNNDHDTSSTIDNTDDNTLREDTTLYYNTTLYHAFSEGAIQNGVIKLSPCTYSGPQTNADSE